MGEEKQLEIYKQRYETFRHLDRLRWQMIQLAVAIFTATALVLRVSDGDVEWWFTLALALALLALSASMLKISQGLRANQVVLSDTAQQVGDESIPNVSNPWRSTYHWISIAVGITGVCFLLSSLRTILG